MIKKEIYPKTQRVKCAGEKVQVTEKLDGSNLCIFKLNDKCYIAQRNNIFTFEELEENKDKLYKGVYQWIQDNKEIFEDNLLNNAVICGEWLGMGQIKYSVDKFDKRLYMFAKANIDEDFNLYNINYNHSLFIYPFENQEIPHIIGIVPVVTDLNVIPTKEHLDSIYEKYKEKEDRNVEGFVVNYRNIISKYVRMKNGQMREHFDRE